MRSCPPAQVALRGWWAWRWQRVVCMHEDRHLLWALQPQGALFRRSLPFRRAHVRVRPAHLAVRALGVTGLYAWSWSAGPCLHAGPMCVFAQLVPAEHLAHARLARLSPCRTTAFRTGQARRVTRGVGGLIPTCRSVVAV